MLKRGQDDVTRKVARFADAQPADGISGKSNVDGSIGRLAAQLTIRPALHNAKQCLRLIRPRSEAPQTLYAPKAPRACAPQNNSCSARPSAQLTPSTPAHAQHPPDTPCIRQTP